jgi:hypothetical protein
LHRPVSGLTRFGSSPSQAFAQWRVDEPTLAYRCGGSTGIIDLKLSNAPVSQFHQITESNVGTYQLDVNYREQKK